SAVRPCWRAMGPSSREYDGSKGPPSLDAAIAARAARQHGVVSLGDLRALGVGQDAVDYRARQGRLHRIHPGVYAVGHASLTARGRWLAAVWACGPRAVLSHWSAAALWDLLPEPGTIVHVTTPNRGR